MALTMYVHPSLIEVRNGVPHVRVFGRLYPLPRWAHVVRGAPTPRPRKAPAKRAKAAASNP